MTQEELNELASDCRLAFGHQAGAYNDGVDAMLRAVSIAQAQAAAPAYNRDAVVVNLMRLANIDKHLAREPDWKGIDMTQREQFEAWATSQGINITDNGFGGYDSQWTEGALAGWEAAQAQAAVEPVGKVLEVAADGSFQTGFFEELPVGTLLYTSPPDDLKFRPDWSGVDVLGEELHEAQKAMRLALKALQGVLKANRITQSRGLPDTYAEADRIRSQIISAVSVAEAAIAALEKEVKHD